MLQQSRHYTDAGMDIVESDLPMIRMLIHLAAGSQLLHDEAGV